METLGNGGMFETGAWATALRFLFGRGRQVTTKLVGAFGAALMILTIGAQARADEPKPKPKFEFEIIGLGAYTPDYPGSDQMNPHGLAVPWLTYRGSFLRTDEKGSVRGRIVDTPRFGLDVSAKGAFPVNSKDNDARDGMPDLDWMGEIGPKFRLTLANWTNPTTGRRARLNFELPVRAAFSTDFSDLDYRGILAHPQLAYDNNDIWGTRVKLGVGPMFATKELTEYFYQVDRAYVRADRPAYEAEAGYMGLRAGLSLARPLGERVTLMGSANFDSFQGAANEDSPLMKDTTNIGVMLGLSVSLYRSEAPAANGGH